MTLIATRSYVYNGAALSAGQAFEPVTAADAQVLILVGSAKADTSEPTPRKRRRYTRKNLIADHA